MRQLFSFILLLVMLSQASGQLPKLVLPIGHSSFINQAVYNSRADMALTASADYTLKVWDTRSGLLLSTLEGHKGSVERAVFSADGRTILSGSSDKTARIWSSNGQCLQVLSLDEKLTAMAMSHDGTLVATGTTSGKVFIWQVKDGKKLLEIPIINEEYNKTITDVAFNISGDKLLVIAGRHKTVWTLNGRLIHEYNIFPPAADFDSSKLVSLLILGDGVTVWNAEDNTAFANLPVNDNMVMKATISADKKVVAASLSDSSLIIWDVLKTIAKMTLPRQKKRITQLALSADGNYLATSGSDSTVTFWNTSTGEIIKALKLNGIVFSLCFSSQDNHLLVSVWDQAIIFDLNNWDYPLTLKGHVTKAYGGHLSKDRTKILFGYEDKVARVLDLETGKTMATITGHSGPVIHAVFYPDDTRIMTASYDGLVKISDATTGMECFKLSTRDKISAAVISLDGKSILTCHNSNYVQLWDAGSGALMKKIQLDGNVPFAAIDPNNKSILVNAENKGLASWDIGSGKFLGQISPASYPMFAYTPDGNHILCVEGNHTRVLDKKGNIHMDLRNERFVGIWDSATLLTMRDNEYHLWEIASKKLLETKPATISFIRALDNLNNRVIAMDNSLGTIADFNSFQQQLVFASVKDENFWLLPTGEFFSSPATSKLFHYVTNDLKVVSFTQLDTRFNRPDLVLKKMGNKDSLLIQSYRSAYLKRIKKLQVDTLAFRQMITMPEADITNSQTIRSATKEPYLVITIHASDPLVYLDRFNVWVNESPLFGMKGFSLKGRDINQFDTTIKLSLSTGQNIIELSFTNQNGIESYKKPLYIKSNPPKPAKETLYFIGIGINKFKQPGNDLNWSVKDIRDLAAGLSNKYGRDITIDTLFDEEVTVENIRALKTKLLSSGVNDKVIISYSGHGLLSKDYDYYLSTYTVNFENPEQNGLPYEALESLLDSIPARNKLLLIDACHSGEVDKEEMDKYVLVEKSLEDSGTKSSRKPVPKDGQLGMKNSFELMQELFVNVGRSTGATVISAAAGTQFAQEKSDLQNGVFTYSILEYMRSHTSATVSELRQYVNNRVSELTQGMQVPTTRSETKAVDWRAW